MACFWEECEESTHLWGEKRTEVEEKKKKAKTERQTRLSHFSASCFELSLLR